MLGLMETVLCTIPSIVSAVSLAGSINEDIQRQKTQAFEKAKEDFTGPEVSARLAQEARRLSCGNAASERLYLASMLDSQNWAKWAFYFMTHSDAQLVDANDEEKEFVNGLGVYVGFGKLYNEAGVADLNKYDAKQQNVGYVGPFLISIDDINDLKMNPAFDMAWKESLTKRRLAQYTAETESNTTQPLVPIVNQPKPKKPDSMPNDLFQRFENALAPFLQGYTYYYDNPDGNYYLNIVRDEAMTSVYMLDDGSIMGGTSLSIMGTFANPQTGWIDTAFVRIDRHPDLVRVIISDPMHIMYNEAEQAFYDFFEKTRIYHNIDFTNTQWMDVLDKDQLAILEKSLFAVTKVLPEDVRLRFMSFTNPKEFVLTTDGARSQMILNGTTAPVSTNEIIVALEPGKMVVRTGGKDSIYAVKYA